MFRGGVFALLLAISAGPVAADFSVFVASVGFDDEANLEGRSGFGVRWGQSSKIFGGETSLMIARPTRTLSSAGVPDETATAIFYEGRLIVNIPLGLPVKPFLGVGLGAITVTSIDLPNAEDGLEENRAALAAIADTQTNRAFSYGGGARYELSEKLAVRLDLRRYSVFSVTSFVQGKITDELRDRTREQLQEETGGEVPDEMLDAALADAIPAESEDKTVAHSEISIGLNFSF